MRSLFATGNETNSLKTRWYIFPSFHPKNHDMFVWSVRIHLHQVFGSAAWKHSVIPSTMNRLLAVRVFYKLFPTGSIGCTWFPIFLFFFFFSTNFVYWSNSCFAAAKKNVPNCKDFICFKRPHIRGKRHEQDLISRTLSHCRSSEILLCFFAGASCDILVQRAAHWLQGFERRRGGQGRIATSGTTQPLKRDLMLEWALRIGLESFLSVCLCGGQCSMCLWEREKIGGERQKGRDGKRGRKGVLK